MSIQLTPGEVGKKFLTRDGEVVKISKYMVGDRWPFKFETGGVEQSCDADGHAWWYKEERPWDIVCRYLDVPDNTVAAGQDVVTFGHVDDALTDDSLLDSVKESNPKDAVGVKKMPLSCVPMPVIAEVSVAMLEGARKYGRHNYRKIGVRASVYFDACFRHLSSWWEGEDTDPDSGLSHLTKAIATLTVLRDAQIRAKMVDDRPPGTVGFVKSLNELSAAVCERYPDAEEPFLGVGTPDQYVA